MKKLFFSLLISSAVLVAFQSQAQLQLPAPSPKASVMQTVGLTEITIDYSSPGVKGRKIWGGLLPYGELWRAGANAATKITFNKDVIIEGVNVAKGSYSIFITPMEKEDWTIHINKDATASTNAYKAENDIVKIKAKPQATSMRENLAYSVTDFSNESAMVNMEWEKIKVSFKVMLDTDKQAMESINSTLGSVWRNYTNSARYMLETKKDYDKGLVYVNQALSLSPDEWFSHWIKAELLKEKGMNKEAYASAVKAKELGDKEGDRFFYKERVEEAVNTWPKK